ncbi:MAG TPA: CPBP family intramembrane glutamic endopeptidase [Rhizomicrobium sp.]|jgi:membrane protease YdiL (CAAX protease family)|nr:CPBP family intramembrane glutamic endopeptidase [Rhizomicrobium sp.]
MPEMVEPRSGAVRVIRAAVIVGIVLALIFGIPLVLRGLNLHDWSKQTFGPNGFYELFIATEFVVIVLAVIAMWRAGLRRAFGELAIAYLSPLGCLCCLAAIAASCAILLLAGAKWTTQRMDSLLIFGVIGPFVEEVLFRGFLFRQMRRWAGVPFWIAAVLASILFGAGHFYAGHSLANAIVNSTVTFVGGVIFCWMIERWDSIWPGFIIHAGLNLLWSVYTLGDNAVGGTIGNIARIATLVIAIVLTWALTRKNSVSLHPGH